ncbi:putative F420-dependent enzyme [Candidatus Protofrankia datiscae]|uniref:Putative F420-dependent enzyme n=2 Tax=Candidatus Protofrankia datiscae TaxID=2716812 RepID=F8B3L9_9ACTN|nr:MULTISPECIES: PPOX class F420-dependent oxidoreductase [Protofrankia]AEH07856.1 putative F420-dependent enzyme [Candidatus Protofrankia datiscae]
MVLGDAKYVAVTTFRKTGVAVSTPTWIVPLDGGRVGFNTSSASGKYKRLRNSPRIVLQPSDARGRVRADSSPVEGTAELATSGDGFDEVQRKVRAKYGVMVSVSRLFNTLSRLGRTKLPYGDIAVIITPAAPS